jgi:hypothetical protein
MLLDLWPGELQRTTHYDDEVRQLADRHYSRRTIGARQFAYSGRKLVLRDAAGEVGWVWMFPDPALRMDAQAGYNCALFRNESARQASDIILEAEQWAIRKWGPGRMYTYIDPAKVTSGLPGYCYLRAGWHCHGLSKGGKLLLVKYDDCPPASLRDRLRQARAATGGTDAASA